MKKKEKHKTPAYPARLLTSRPPPLHRLRRARWLLARQTYDLHYSSLIILAFIAIEKQTLGKDFFVLLFFWIMRAERGKNSWVGAFGFVIFNDTGFSKKFLGFLHLLIFAGCITEQEVGSDG
jgi:hypothetical protein